MNAAGIKLLFRIWRYEISPERLVADLPLFNMLNLRYILAPATTPLAQVPELKNIASLDLNIYESEHVWPRAVHEIEVVVVARQLDAVIPRDVPHAPITDQVARPGACDRAPLQQ